MSHMTQVSFTVKDTPMTLGKQVYIILHGGQQNKVYQMDKTNDAYQKSIFVNHKVHYNYKYMVADSSQNKKEEIGFRNFRYKKQDFKFLDYWNSKDVILRICARQQSIINGLQINAYQKINSETQIKNSEIELKEIKQNGITKYYEGIIYAQSAMNILEFQFFFNANKQDKNKQEYQFMKYYQQFYSTLKTVGNQSFIEIDQKEFDKLSSNPIVIKERQSFLNNLEYLPDNYKYSYELSHDNIQNLLQIYETSLRNYQEKLQSKDKQIKDLQLEKLERDEFIIFNYQDLFEPDVLSEYQNEFYSIVKEIQKIQKSIFQQFNQKINQNEQTVQEYKTAVQQYKAEIEDKTKTIETLLQKVIQEKNKQEKNGQKIQQLDEQISIYKKVLDQKKKAAEELEKQLNQEKQYNQEIIIEKEKFQKQVTVLDFEVKEFKRKNENLQKENQSAIQEKENVMKQAYEKDAQLHTIQSENRNLTQKQKLSQKDLEEAQQFIRSYNESAIGVTNIFKDIRIILVQQLENNLHDLKNIITVHKEQEISIDVGNLTIQIAQIEQGLKNLIEDKMTLQYLEVYYQKQVQNQLQFLFYSSRIREEEKIKINNIQYQITSILEVLKKFGSIKEIVGKPKPILQRQTTEASLKLIRSPQYVKIGVQRKATYQ